jgi:4-hydroxy-4-methyl-2-oxoglutarate aldolase
MSGTVARNIHRAHAGVIAALARLGVSTVHEAHGRSGLMQPYMRPVWRGARIAGSAVTALCHPGDKLGLDIYDTRKHRAEKGLTYLDGPLE